MRAFNLKFTRQKMKKYLILLAAAFILSACSSPLNIQNARNKELLAYTSKFEKGDFLALGAYINPVYDKEKSKEFEYFILNIIPKNAQILNGTISVNNENSGITIKELSPDDEILKDIDFKISWAKYYLISAPVKNSAVLHLNFNAVVSEKYPSVLVSLSFQKIAKSLYWSPR